MNRNSAAWDARIFLSVIATAEGGGRSRTLAWRCVAGARRGVRDRRMSMRIGEWRVVRERPGLLRYARNDDSGASRRAEMLRRAAQGVQGPRAHGCARAVALHEPHPGSWSARTLPIRHRDGRRPVAIQDVGVALRCGRVSWRASVPKSSVRVMALVLSRRCECVSGHTSESWGCARTRAGGCCLRRRADVLPPAFFHGVSAVEQMRHTLDRCGGPRWRCVARAAKRIYTAGMEFTWSERKRSLNLQQHGLDLSMRLRCLVV